MNRQLLSTFVQTPEINRKWEYGEGCEFVDPEEQIQRDYERNMQAAQPYWKKIGYQVCEECGANPCYSHCKRYE